MVPSIERIDVHTHILPRSLPNLEELYGYGGWIHLHKTASGCTHMLKNNTFFRAVEENCLDPEARLADCDRDGVTIQVLSPVPIYFSYWARPADCLDLCRRINDELIAICNANPTRFVALGIVPMQDPALAVQELRRCMDLGFCGIEIGSHVNGTNLGDPSLFPVFEEAAKLEAAVFVHPWDMMGADTMDKYWLPWLVGMPAETSRAICSLMMSGVMERLPKLKLCFAHGGGSFPATVGRIEHGYNCRPDLCAIDAAVPPRQHLGSFYIDSLVHDPATLAFVLSVVGEDNIVLGSDYPFPLGEAKPGALVANHPTLTPEQKRKILVDNAIAFLGLRRRAPFQFLSE